MNQEPLILPRNCGNCAHFDEDAHCALHYRDQLIRGAIIEPELVVCGKHEPKEGDEK
ncbi:MAG: hypothetical protein ACKVQA_06930 [Burkholderiales bacterium]